MQQAQYQYYAQNPQFTGALHHNFDVTAGAADRQSLGGNLMFNTHNAVQRGGGGGSHAQLMLATESPARQSPGAAESPAKQAGGPEMKAPNRTSSRRASTLNFINGQWVE